MMEGWSQRECCEEEVEEGGKSEGWMEEEEGEEERDSGREQKD